MPWYIAPLLALLAPLMLARWERAPDLLRAGGMLLIDAFAIRQHEEFGFPERFCLQPGELRGVSDRLELVLHEEHGAPEKYLEGYIFRKKK